MPHSRQAAMYQTSAAAWPLLLQALGKFLEFKAILASFEAVDLLLLNLVAVAVSAVLLIRRYRIPSRMCSAAATLPRFSKFDGQPCRVILYISEHVPVLHTKGVALSSLVGSELSLQLPLHFYSVRRQVHLLAHRIIIIIIYYANMVMWVTSTTAMQELAESQLETELG